MNQSVEELRVKKLRDQLLQNSAPEGGTIVRSPHNVANGLGFVLNQSRPGTVMPDFVRDLYPENELGTQRELHVACVLLAIALASELSETDWAKYFGNSRNLIYPEE